MSMERNQWKEGFIDSLVKTEIIRWTAVVGRE